MAEWLKTGETESGLIVFCKIEDSEGAKYLYFKYTDTKGNRVGQINIIPVEQVKFMNGLVDCYRMEYGWDI